MKIQFYQRGEQMKRFLLLITMVLCLSGCEGEGHPNKNDKTYREQLAGGYFTVLEKWDGNYIVYANDTKVKYFWKYVGSVCGMTPLYNADGSLQIYEGE